MGFPPDITVWGENNRCSVLTILEEKVLFRVSLCQYFYLFQDGYVTVICILVRENIKRAQWSDTEEVKVFEFV